MKEYEISICASNETWAFSPSIGHKHNFFYIYFFLLIYIYIYIYFFFVLYFFKILQYTIQFFKCNTVCYNFFLICFILNICFTIERSICIFMFMFERSICIDSKKTLYIIWEALQLCSNMLYTKHVFHEFIWNSLEYYK